MRVRTASQLHYLACHWLEDKVSSRQISELGIRSRQLGIVKRKVKREERPEQFGHYYLLCDLGVTGGTCLEAITPKVFEIFKSFKRNVLS